MADKFIKISTGGDLTEANPITTSAGSSNAGQIIATNAAGQIDSTLLPNSTTITVTASEAIAAGAMINIWLNAGNVAVRNADNTALAKQAHGFAPAAISSSASGTVSLWDGENTGLSGLTIGATYFLGTAGAVTMTPPTATASIVQKIGAARSATELSVAIQQPIVRA